MWFAPLGAVTLLGAVAAFRLGWIVAETDESAMIDHYAARYVHETGRPATECLARPSREPGLWLVVACGQGVRIVRYHVNRLGGLDRRETGAAAQGRGPRT